MLMENTNTAKKIKTTAAVFELPQRLGILQHVEYEPPPREWCTSEGCLYEGWLSAKGCYKGICIKYRAWVWSKDGRTWEVKERWRRRRDEEGGCIRQQVADALWELVGRFEVVEVGLWYEQRGDFCGIVVNGVRLYQPRCRSPEECVEKILEDYRHEVERAKQPPPPPPPDPVEELLKEWPELEAFGADWLRIWARHARDRVVEIANAMRRYPWMVEVLRRRPVVNPHPYMVEAYVAVDGSEACLSLSPPKAYCARGGAVGEARLELEFSRYEVYEGRIREVYRPKGLLAFTARAKEYVRIL
jgi:hypothetical protein